MFRECTFARCFWRNLHAKSNSLNFFQGSMHEWLRKNILSRTCLSYPFHVPWTFMFQFGIWNIWRHRNKYLFEPPAYTVEELVKLTLSQACAYWHINFNYSPTHLQTRSQLLSNITHVHQDGPLSGEVIVTLHESFQHQRASAFAAVIFYQRGTWVKALSGRMLTSDNLSLTFWAIYHALLFSWAEGFRNVVSKCSAFTSWRIKSPELMYI